MALLTYLAVYVAFICTSLTGVAADHSFENTAIVRTVELGGSNVHVRRTFVAKALETGSAIYTFALGRQEAETTSFLEARLKNEAERLELQHFGLNTPSYVLVYFSRLLYRLLIEPQGYISVCYSAPKSSEKRRRRHYRTGYRPDSRDISLACFRWPE